MNAFLFILLLGLPAAISSTQSLRRAQQVVQPQYVDPDFRYVPFSEVDNVAAAASLGYTETTWNLLGSATIEETAFSALSRAQRQSAILLGFNEESWDCDQNHYGGYDWSELVLYDLVQHFTALGWTRRMWQLRSPPASYNLPWNRLTDAQQEAAEELCYFYESWDGISIDKWGYEEPDFRYVPFSQVDNAAAVASLGYTETTWNLLGSAAIEETRFADLGRSQKESAIRLGFNEESWDCDQNHYGGYDWSELVQYDLVQHFRPLGWNYGMWQSGLGAPPASYNLTWNELTEAQRAAAETLCYFEESWDGISIDAWGSEDQTENIFEPDKKEQWGYEVPNFRYVPFSEVENVAAAESLGYTETTWNLLGTASIEETAFSDLSRDQQESATRLGFNEESWDCDQNHYGGYDWYELVQYNLDEYFRLFGWNRAMWQFGVDAPPASFRLYWNQLTEVQREAAVELCYFQESWDGISIDTWDQTSNADGIEQQQQHVMREPTLQMEPNTTDGSADQMVKLMKIDETDQNQEGVEDYFFLHQEQEEEEEEEQEEEETCCLCNNCADPIESLWIAQPPKSGGYTCNTLAKLMPQWYGHNLISTEICQYYRSAYAPSCCH